MDRPRKAGPGALVEGGRHGEVHDYNFGSRSFLGLELQRTLTQQTRGPHGDPGSWGARCVYQRSQRGQGRG